MSLRHSNLVAMAKVWQGLRSWKVVFEQISLTKVEKVMRANYYRSKQSKAILARTFYAMLEILRESRTATLERRHSSTLALTAPLSRI